MAQYVVQQVVATGCTDALVAFRLPLPEPAWEVTAIQKTVLLDRTAVTLGSVLLQGRLRACYTVGVLEGTRPPALGMPHPPGGVLAVMQGPLRAVWAEAPFCLAIALERAEPGQELTVTAAHVTTQVVDLAQVNEHGLIVALDDQSMLHLAIRLTRPRDLHTMAAPPPPEADVTPRSAGGRRTRKEPSHAPKPPGPQGRKAAFARFQSKPR